MHFRLGILGATGYIATPYRSEIRQSPDEARIVAMCARRREQLEAAAREDGAILATDDWRAVVEHPDVNTLLVATPDALHYEPVMAAVRLGKHIICEKPIGVNVAQAHDMWTACRESGVGHFVPFWTRYVPVFRRAREVVQSGMLGQIRAANLRWVNPRPLSMPFTWRDDATLSSAGSIADVGTHAYDMLRWLTGLSATRVLAHATVLTPAKPDLGAVNLDEALKLAEQRPLPPTSAAETLALRRGTAFDYASMSFELTTGAVGTLMVAHAPYLRRSHVPEIELHGTLASLALDRTAATLTLCRPGEPPELYDTVPFEGYGNRFGDHVFPALRQRIAGQPCDHPGLDDGLAAQLFSDAASESARCGTWVDAV